MQKCTTRLVSGTVKFKTESGDLGASVSRAHVVLHHRRGGAARRRAMAASTHPPHAPTAPRPLHPHAENTPRPAPNCRAHNDHNHLSDDQAEQAGASAPGRRPGRRKAAATGLHAAAPRAMSTHTFCVRRDHADDDIDRDDQCFWIVAVAASDPRLLLQAVAVGQTTQSIGASIGRGTPPSERLAETAINWDSGSNRARIWSTSPHP